ALVALAACSAGDSGRVRAAEPGAPPDRPATSAQHLTVEPRTFRREHGSCRRDGADTAALPCLTITIAYPEVMDAASPALADSVRAFVRGAALAGGGEDTTLAADAPAMAAALVEDYEEARPYFGDYVEVWSVD